MRITLIGGTRFIGHAATERLIERGHEVTVIHRGVHPCEVKGARVIRADRNHPQRLIAAVMHVDTEAVIDTRALTRSHAEVTAMALKLLELPAVVLSSQDVYAQFGRLLGHPGPAPTVTVDETAPLTVPYPYRGVADHEGGDDYDKKDVEAVFRKAAEGDLPGVTILRLPPTYGNRDPKRRFAFIVDTLDRTGGELPHIGGAPWRCTHAHVRDVAQAIALAVEQIEEGVRIFNVGEAETPMMRERAERIAAQLDIALHWQEVEELPDELRDLGPRRNPFVASSRAIRDALGFEEITTEAERLADLIAWLRTSREHGSWR
jgi:nucleoside-diphosphate-sugar epimerase